MLRKGIFLSEKIEGNERSKKIRRRNCMDCRDSAIARIRFVRRCSRFRISRAGENAGLARARLRGRNEISARSAAGRFAGDDERREKRDRLRNQLQLAATVLDGSCAGSFEWRCRGTRMDFSLRVGKRLPRGSVEKAERTRREDARTICGAV